MTAKQKFIAVIDPASAARIANCATDISGFPSYSTLCINNIFTAQSELIAKLDVEVALFSSTHNTVAISREVRFDFNDSIGHFHLIAEMEVEFIPFDTEVRDEPAN